MEPVTKRNSLGYRLREQRDSYNLTQREVAEGIGVTPPAINFLERNKVKPTQQQLIALARFYNVSVHYLEYGTPAPDQLLPRTPEEVEALAIFRSVPPKAHQGMVAVLRATATLPIAGARR